MPVAPGENPAYDVVAERHLAARRAQYALVEEDVAHEAKKNELQAALMQAKRLEEKTRVAHIQAKDALRIAKEAYASVDTDLRASRRARNSALQREAAEEGAKTYDTGTPCRNGHFAPRYTSSGACTQCDRIGWRDGKLASAY
jgi:hypothetical protein